MNLLYFKNHTKMNKITYKCCDKQQIQNINAITHKVLALKLKIAIHNKNTKLDHKLQHHLTNQLNHINFDKYLNK